MDISSVNSDLIRGNVTTIILGCLFANDKYGYEILKEIEDKSHSQYALKQATLYNQLKRLEKQGLVTSYDGAPDDTGGGKRRYYALTPEGRSYLTKEKSEYEYSRTILDKLVSEKEFDFTKEIPFDASELRPYSKREPGDEKPKVVYKEKVVEVENIVYLDIYGNRITEEESKQAALQAMIDDEQARKNERDLLSTREQLLALEDERNANAEKLRLLEEERAEREEQLRAAEEERNAKAEQLRLLEEERAEREEQLRAAEEERNAKAEQLRLLEEERAEREEQLRSTENERTANSEQLRILEENLAAREQRLHALEEDCNAKVEQLRLLKEQRDNCEEQLHISELDCAAKTEQLRFLEVDRIARENRLLTAEKERAASEELLHTSELERAAKDEELRIAQAERDEANEQLRIYNEQKLAEDARRRAAQQQPSVNITELFAKLDAQSEYQRNTANIQQQPEQQNIPVQQTQSEQQIALDRQKELEQHQYLEQQRQFEQQQYFEQQRQYLEQQRQYVEQQMQYVESVKAEIEPAVYQSEPAASYDEQPVRKHKSMEEILRYIDEKRAQHTAEVERAQAEAQMEAAVAADNQYADDRYYESELQSDQTSNAAANSNGVTSAVINFNEQGFAYENDSVNYRDFFYSIAEHQQPKQELEEPKKQQQSQYSDDIKTRLYAKGFKVRPYDRGNTSEYYTFNFIQSNRINRDTFLIILALYVAEVAVMWISLTKRISYTYFLPLLLVGAALCLIPTVIYLFNPNKRSRAHFNFKLSILNRTMLFIELSVVCILIGFFALGASVNDINIILSAIILPAVLLLDLPISSIVYYLLYRTHKYHIS